MSIIGTLETLPLPLLLRRIEAFTKTGLMAITQGAQSVELYFRDGKLMCVGPVRTDITLAERLAQDRMISSQVVQEVEQIADISSSGETGMARALMEMGYIRREELRTWMTQKVTDVVRVLLTWKSGSIDFVEDVDEPAARLLVSLSISSLLDSLATSLNPELRSDMESEQGVVTEQEEYEAIETRLMPASQPVHQTIVKQETLLQPVLQIEQSAHSYLSVQQGLASTVALSDSDITKKATLYDASQFMAPPTESPLPFFSPELLSSLSVPNVPDTGIPADFYLNVSDLFSGLDDLLNEKQDKLHPIASSVTTPAPDASRPSPRQVDTSFMQADMVMMPVEVSHGDECVLITPTQWQLLTRVDGQTSLEQVHKELRLSPIQVCQTAGELIAEGFIQVVSPHMLQEQQDIRAFATQPATPLELSPASRELVSAGLHNGLVAPGSHASVASSWGDGFPDSRLTQLAPSFETQSQWGNGGNGASFVIGKSWTTSPQPLLPLQPLPSSGPLAFHSGSYPNVQRR